MEELSVTIKICDRIYPMKVHAVDEEKIRKAGKLINDQVRLYGEQFGIHDKQDLLAMVAFDCLVDKLKSVDTTDETTQIAKEELHSLLYLLDDALTQVP